MSVIHVQGLHFTYPPYMPGDSQRIVALHNINFEIETGACLAVTGPNGCGKTTLCLSVAGLAPRLTAGRINGTITIAGKNVQALKPGTLADQIGVVFDDPVGQLFMPTIADEIAWGLENLGMAPAEITSRIEWALQAVHLEHIPRSQTPDTLSGGQQKRLALAVALAPQPDVLILDEPSSGLSPSSRNDMIDLLKNLRQQMGLTILMSESNPAFIIDIADQILVLDRGHIALQGTPRQVYYNALPDGTPHPPAVIFAQNLGEADSVSHPLTVTEAAKCISSYTIDTEQARPGPVPRNTPVIQLDSVSFAYQPDRPTLTGVNLIMYEGEWVILTGDNGAGKTTLARHLIGLVRPDQGMVYVNQQPTHNQSIGQLARQIGFAFQTPEVQIFNPTVEEEISFGPRNMGMDNFTITQVVHETLAQFDLEDVAQHPPAALTFSKRRLVALASIAAMRTPILVLDEPLAGLDITGRAIILSWLKARHQSGATILLISHDMEVAAYADRMLIMHHGGIIADDTPLHLFTQSDAPTVAGLEPPFTIQLAQQTGQTALISDLTPAGAAQAVLHGSLTS